MQERYRKLRIDYPSGVSSEPGGGFCIALRFIRGPEVDFFNISRSSELM
jgi:hypothetical protein